jgi:Uma2 family endonuclease
MAQVLTFPEPVSLLSVRRSSRGRTLELSDDDYWALCEANPELRLERTAQGEIAIMPPAGGDSDYRSAESIGELRQWARREGTGRSFGSSVQFFLPDGSGLSPDAAWVSNQNLAHLSKEERKKFLRLVPEFIIEVRSLSDRLKDLKSKMARWIANGVQLAWLIDGDAETVYVYRRGQPMRIQTLAPPSPRSPRPSGTTPPFAATNPGTPRRAK